MADRVVLGWDSDWDFCLCCLVLCWSYMAAGFNFGIAETVRAGSG